MRLLCVTAHAWSKLFHDFFPVFDHRARAAFRALSARSSAVSFLARAFPPFNPPKRPSATAAAFFPPDILGFTTDISHKGDHHRKPRSQPPPHAPQAHAFDSIPVSATLLRQMPEQ